jgi:hypothetical protein
MKNTTIALFLLALVGNAFAGSDCATTTEKAKTEEEMKKELETKVDGGTETQK